MKDTEKKDKYRIYGELLNTYGYSLSPEDKFLDTVNYYTGEPVRVPLDTQLSPAENAKKYFEENPEIMAEVEKKVRAKFNEAFEKSLSDEMEVDAEQETEPTEEE